MQDDFHWLESKIEWAVEKNGNLMHPTKRVAEIRDHIYDGINDMDPTEYFEKKFPLHLSMYQRIKNMMPVKTKLILKRVYWAIRKFPK